MKGKHSDRYKRLVAGFAASAFALLTIATVQHQAVEKQVAQLTHASAID